MCFQVSLCLLLYRIRSARGKIVSLCGSRNVYVFTLKVGSFSLLFTCCRVLVTAAMLVVNGSVSLARDDCMTERRSMKNHAKR